MRKSKSILITQDKSFDRESVIDTKIRYKKSNHQFHLNQKRGIVYRINRFVFIYLFLNLIH